ncbi:hypothetical protein D9756_011297 [Leucocoprinus leucothites]|uniref:Uncharacterized protein n=1 Tax=Leucocoprinus leucothites TaxID=201217 RepID=A0A8H5CQ27_9AGAR|nr:hypothetical protein D9756_011297 [Leucoagaricus leucothites]
MADDEAYSSLSDITSDFENDNGESEVNEVVDGEDVPMDGASGHKSPSKPRGGRRAAGTKKGNKEKGSGYTIKDALKAPRATTYTS